MIYSCFDDKIGQYRYFQDDLNVAINADLPIPQLPRQAGAIGAPAIESGRPLPYAATPAGSGFHARGMIVQCGSGGLGSVDDAVSWVKQDGWKWGLGIFAAYIVVRHVL